MLGVTDLDVFYGDARALWDVSMNVDALLNDFALRCFRDSADQDYIAARMSYRAALIPQFHWSGLQAVEKYLKAILLLNRIEATSVNHDLNRALERAKKLPFEIKLSHLATEFIQHLDTFGTLPVSRDVLFHTGPQACAARQNDLGDQTLLQSCRLRAES